MHQPARRAFTLIELLVVISIIAMLIAILLPALQNARATGRQVQCLSQLRQFGILAAAYQGENSGFFPSGSMIYAPPEADFTMRFRPFHRMMNLYRPALDLLLCPDVSSPETGPGSTVRGRPVGVDGFNLREQYNLPIDMQLINSYGSNEAASFYGVTNSWVAARTSNFEGDWKKPSETGLYADCSGIVFENRDPLANRMLRVANANSSQFYAEFFSPEIVPEHKRHVAGSNVQYMDGHGEALSQEDALDVRVNLLDP